MIGVIPAAGRGVRFKELGKNYSKTILPYKEKPILIYQIEWLEQHGCNDIRVVLNHQEDTVKNILSFYNKKVTIVRQQECVGLADAVFTSLNETDDDNVLVLLGDLIVDDKVQTELFNKNFISVKEVHDYSRWCMVEDCGNGKVIFYDKPKSRPDTNLAVSGVYHFRNSRNLYDILKNQIVNDVSKISGEFQISTALEKLDNIYTIMLKIIDFGTLEEYLTNRSIKTSRSFNEIAEVDSFIIKSSTKHNEKIIAEFNWFENLPDSIKIHTPRIFDHGFFGEIAYYKMEKILMPSLRELFLFIDSSEETWDNIFNSMFELLFMMEQYGQENTFMKSVIDKTELRVRDIDIPIEIKYINEFIKNLKQKIEFIKPRYTLMHGDFCFSNLLYDFQNNSVKMIDPRGQLFGNHYYEVAKITHSVLYDYDFVDAELYVKNNSEYKIYNNGKEKIKELFISKLHKYYSKDEINFILTITASLFLSMIPLHSHNRNNQLIYYNIFTEICKEI